MTALSIAGTAIRQDDAGRYCLNDLHKASGGNPNHRPGEWLRNKQTQALAAEIGDAEIPASAPIASIKGGDGAQGTYVAKELVYAYAMWISPAFNLKVIRAYDQLVTVPVADPMKVLNDPAAMRGLLLTYTERVIALESTIKEQAPAVEFTQAVVSAENPITIRDVAKSLQYRERLLRQKLREKGVLLADGTAAALYVTKGYLLNQPFTLPDSGKVKFSAKVTGLGYVFLQRFAARHLGPSPSQPQPRLI